MLLARYAQVIGYSECALFGIAVPDTIERHCREIWILSQRQMIARYLAEAQLEIEQEIGYPVGKRWITEDQVPYTLPALARNRHLIEGGIQATSLISAGEAVSHVADPAVIGPFATTVTDVDEIIVYHPGTTIEIPPSSISIVAGQCTIEIPRCRMVIAAYSDNPDSGWDYNDVANWAETTVDVYRVYNDPSTQAVLVRNHNCNVSCAMTGCTEYTQTACIYVAQPDIGAIEVYPASYSEGAWLRNACQYRWRWMRLNYRAGVDITFQAEDAIIRLAHAKMPVEPCGCDPIKSLWARDRHVPEALTRERINCKFGLSDGAWAAWQFATAMKVWRASVI